jgi:hypothetical protein
VEAKTTHEKLYWPEEELKRTTTFISRAALQMEPGHRKEED